MIATRLVTGIYSPATPKLEMNDYEILKVSASVL